ncbi:hypothetical protein PC121_g12412 [Phytophthora cactorum]|nr:hypothetical protein PC121_g12412 [Phytophthora cactorum]
MHQGAKVDALEGISDAAEEKRACDVVEEVGREADVHREEDMAEACSSGGAETDLPQAGRVRKIVYRCSKYRTGCKGKMEYTIAAMGYTTVRAPKCSDNVVASSIRNVEAEMKAQSDLLAIENVAWPARQVWEERRTLIDNDFAPKTYAEWMNPKNVTAKVTQLATMGLLQIVQLTNRNLQVLPEEIRGCTEMRYISLVYTHAQTLPVWIKELKQLEYLETRGRKSDDWSG